MQRKTEENIFSTADVIVVERAVVNGVMVAKGDKQPRGDCILKKIMDLLCQRPSVIIGFTFLLWCFLLSDYLFSYQPPGFIR
jgi:hypothetical protein